MHTTKLDLAAILAVFAFAITIPFSVTGCRSTDGSPPTAAQIVTPARVEAVTALSALYGARDALRAGHGADLERARAGLAAILAQDKRDLAAVAAALEAGRLTWLASPEGSLAISLAGAIFVDDYGPDRLLGNEYADAILTGALRGIDLALRDGAGTRTRGAPSPEDALAQDARRTRPR